MHLGHRRSNSYSLPPAAGCNEDQSILPPPPILSNRLNTAALERPEFATLQQFTRASGERRSFNSSQTTDTWSPVRNSSRSYKGVAISRATPALVRYNISPETDWLFDMSRPRSPSKVWKSGPVDAGVPSLDQALAAVKEQLAMLKHERADISNRVDDLATEIHATVYRYNKRSNTMSSTTRTPGSPQDSPGRSLRRIKSLEGRAQSYTQLHNIVKGEEMQDSDEYLSGSPARQRKNSVPSKVVRSVGHGSTGTSHSPFNTGRSFTHAKSIESIPARRVSSNSNRRSLQALETIIDNSPHMYNIDCGSSDSTPENSPKLIRVRSVHSLNKTSTRVLVAPRPSSRSSSQTLYKAGPFNTLPTRKSSSTSSTNNLNDDTMSESMSIPDALWDECSLQSEGSMVLRISSATGQVEKVPRTSSTSSASDHKPSSLWGGKGKVYTSSIETLVSPTGSAQVAPLLGRHHQLSRCNYDQALSMTFTEEPRPLSLCLEPSPSPCPSQQKRSSAIILHSIETTV